MSEIPSPDSVVLIDVGNTTIAFGFHDGHRLTEHYRIATDRGRTADEHAGLLLPLLSRAEIDPHSFRGVIVSSVVPTLNPTITRLSNRLFETEPLFVEPGIHMGMHISHDHPEEVGADRIVNAVAALHLYGCPTVVVDFGTATTFDIVNADGDYQGGIIAPGLEISAEALFSRASRLYRVDTRRPDELIATHTAGAMQSGIFFGYVGLVDGILERLIAELGPLQKIVATGGQAESIAQESKLIEEVSPLLTLTGLRLLYERNQAR